WATSPHMNAISVARTVAWEAVYARPRPRGAESLAQALLIQDMFGNPFQPVPEIHPAWLTWRGGFIPAPARTISNERDLDRLPIPADALEEAGCTDTAVLEHCRSGGEHVRGCRVLDLLLGKE